MNLYEIIKSLQEAQGSNAKQAILMQHKGNALLKEYMKAVYDPSINYYQSKAPIPSFAYTDDLEEHNIKGIVHMLSDRVVTGNLAKGWLKGEMEVFNAQGQELIKLMIDRSIGAGVGDTMVLKTWPSLYFIPPYMRCSLLNEKTRKNFPDGELFICQLKADGMYMSLFTNGKAYTRQGNAFPSWLVEQLLVGADYSRVNPQVLLGEVLVNKKANGERLSRQEGNGILNSILKGAEQSEFVGYEFYIECWDMLSVEDFEAGICNIPYSRRYSEMVERIECEFEHALVIPTYFVNSLEEAFAINNKFLADNLEGSVIKSLSHKWKDGTSSFNVKLKIAIELDLKITGVVEGAGKAAGMCGALQLTSSCGKIVTDVGTGMTDDMRKVFWMHKHDMIGKIVTIKANDIISKRGSDTFSCFLPVFVEERLDKTEANSYDECVAILSAAKGITTG